MEERMRYYCRNGLWNLERLDRLFEDNKITEELYNELKALLPNNQFKSAYILGGFYFIWQQPKYNLLIFQLHSNRKERIMNNEIADAKTVMGVMKAAVKLGILK